MKHFLFLMLFFVVLANCYTQDLNDTSNGINDFDSVIGEKNANNKTIYAISRSTLGLGGSSKVITTPNGTYYISQSIGQTSVIGTKINRNYTILQGYQLSSIKVSMIENVENDLKATIYPNPFEESISISFDMLIKNEIVIHIFDMTGREIFSKKYPPNQILTIPLNYISSGIYRLLVTADNLRFVASILKK